MLHLRWSGEIEGATQEDDFRESYPAVERGLRVQEHQQDGLDTLGDGVGQAEREKTREN